MEFSVFSSINKPLCLYHCFQEAEQEKKKTFWNKFYIYIYKNSFIGLMIKYKGKNWGLPSLNQMNFFQQYYPICFKFWIILQFYKAHLLLFFLLYYLSSFPTLIQIWVYIFRPCLYIFRVLHISRILFFVSLCISMYISTITKGGMNSHSPAHYWIKQVA